MIRSIYLLILLAIPAYAQVSVMRVERAPELAPACPCEKCTCDPCKCVKPAVSVKVSETPPGLAKRATPTEASVKVRCSNGKEVYQCSGTAVCNHTILTCAHIVRDGWDLTVNGGHARLLAINKKADIALLQTENEQKPAEIAVAMPKLHEPVTAYGYEHDKQGKLWYFPSRVTAINRYSGFANQSIAGTPKSGRSGGGLFNAAGELVGVCSAADGREGLYAGLPAIQALVTQKLVDHTQYAAPDFSASPAPTKGAGKQACPNGNYPKPSTPAPLAKAPTGQVFSNCPNGQCGRSSAPARASSGAVIPSPSAPSHYVPRRSGLFGRRR